MRLSPKVAELLETGWQIHDEFETVLSNSGSESKIPIGLKPGMICREIDGIFLTYDREDIGN